MSTIDAAIDARAAQAVQLRHQLHRIPELGYEEFQTAAAIRAELDRLRIAHVDGLADVPTATIVLIGDTSKPCIALRADIDALPITEQTGLPYASTHAGKMHACGHDGHMAALLGAAAVLQSIQNELPVCVKLIWQPAEEGGGGAQRLVNAGVLDGRVGPKVRAIFGLHGWPGLPVGCVATKPGALLAATDNFRVTFIGKGCHGAFPHLGADPIVAAAEAVVNLQQIVARQIDPTEPALVTVGIISGGTATNIIPDQAVIEGTVRTLGEPTRKLARSAIGQRCQSIAAAGGCSAKLDWFEGYPATINDPAMSDYVAFVARQTLGSDRFIPVARPCMGGEDFAYYLEQIPGCFFLIGVEPPGLGGGAYPSLHSDRYDFLDAAVPVGMRMFVALAINFVV
ncbi:MAG: M20 family metallopeptidase [Tepidisphaeraceae bacterium]